MRLSTRRSTRAVRVVAAVLSLALTGSALGPAASATEERLDTTDQQRSPHTIVVAQDGSGDIATVGAAVETAQDGDIVLVRPGVYREALEVRRDIAIVGDEGGLVVLEAEAAGPALRIIDAEATLRDLVFRGEGSAVVVHGGRPTLEGLRFESVGMERGANLFDVALLLDRGSRAIVRGNRFVASGDIRLEGGAAPLLAGNELSAGGGIVVADAGSAAVVRGNSISGARLHGIEILSPGGLRIEGNVIDGAESSGVAIGGGRSPGVDPVVLGNSISASSFGISVTQLAEPSLIGNVLKGNAVGISTAVSDATIEGNRISDGGVGVAMVRHAPLLRGNVIEGNEIGYLAEVATTPRLEGNLLCGNETDVVLTPGAAVLDRTKDRTCPQDP